MRKLGVLCASFSAVMALLLAFPAVAEEPGDALLEVFEKDIKPAESLLPPGITVAEGFQPGAGDPIGTVKSTKGRTLVVHRGASTAYEAKKDSPLFSFDTLVTEEKARADIAFNDGSFITLGTYTKIVLDKSVFDPSKSTRESFMRLLFGKARFIVTKLADFRSSQYRVKTPTAVVGVRGSDFAVAVAPGSPLMTTIATNKGTTVLFAGDTGPAQVIGPMQAATAKAGKQASAALDISRFPPFKAVGMHNALKWGLGIGGAAVVGGVLAGGSSDSGSGALTVANWSPPEGSTFFTLDAQNLVSFVFSRGIDSPPNVQVNSLDPGWTIFSSTLQTDNKVLILDIRNPNSALTNDIIIDLGGITTDGGSTPLSGKTTFTYVVG